MTVVLIVGGIVTAVLLLNAVLSFIEQGGSWASWFRLQTVAYAMLVTAVVAGWFR